MYHTWLDRWDEKRAQRGDAVKHVTDFSLGTELAFPVAKSATSIQDFCTLANQAIEDRAFFDAPELLASSFEKEGDSIKFPSGISTGTEENNTAYAKITKGGSTRQALVVFHHWNADKPNHQLARYFARRGVTVVEMALPYHFERSRLGSSYADYMLSPNLGRTIQSVRQAVLDAKLLISWLKREGYEEIALLGMSLGSWVAGLVAAHDARVSKAALFLTAGSLAEMVWTGRATRAIRESLEPAIDLDDLNRAWAPLNLENYANNLARHDLALQVVLASRDKVVLPELSKRFVEKLKNAGARPDVVALNCGHYSLAMPPYIVFAGLNLRRLLRRG
ncbi:alpha/beta hydrolase family protein [Pseudosulfitobacter pseudonitzschiae]|uniref:alpha/beta hydrolase family protein n=1 Tax=Pseudosulfitobacter pseudonitzschiae TaxID=1402135 RepID=UPI001AFA238D|nr:alpha/beta hydrolase family protein [Pseudosulfitobacter pseudonitzschiae]MBM1818134.1 alpha/beta hydrolase family protein [Pseudosulfitobacter pseudonitzschiae]MBM1835199.1 alpha/beta hydrolase family protein [Pseudosulfitobacter pseudonitzschiae]MBM1840046.1 alpha/beta hydrolase family protein [Pseudosulfitobacter pseudonitzschiae]MBM1844909.1 alpha/beta hydrolase family protein [Pseudosulfitobacter pseudonitzschiae]MBM1849743.1 alpha/beta hydrolase family protein [Pseudosulfitobacter pse